jgi:chloramphenicol 3-O phosphotransferase
VIIFLNGTSSSGKSSIAAELLKVLEPSYFHLSIDAFSGMCDGERATKLDAPELSKLLHRMRAGFHRAVAGMARAGNDVIVDYLLSEPWRLQDCLEVMDGLDVVLVGVQCPSDELDRRERDRGDRALGTGAAQRLTVHQHGLYDFEVDTGTSSARECAEAIKEFVEQAPGQRAFDVLRLEAGH